MKRLNLVLLALCALLCVNVSAADIKYVDAQKLTHLGKMCKTTNPYHRVEVADYPELTKTEANLLLNTSGEAILFETDSKSIWVKAEFGISRCPGGMTMNAACGFNLYIEEDGEWIWAASRSNAAGKDEKGNNRLDKPLRLIAHMDGETKRCMIYLPLFSELKSLEIGVDEGASIRPIDNPFRHKIAIFGSSYTHGHGATCAGQTYPAFLQRQTGLYFCSFGMSGNSKLQRVMGEILASTDAEAYVVDAFSNPTIEEIGARIRPFIAEIRKTHPTAPIIFLRTIYRESRNFDTKVEAAEQSRIDFVEKLMADIVKEYDDVYYINVADQTGDDHNTSTDGTHPSSWGYKRWADSIQPQIVKILKRYGIE